MKGSRPHSLAVVTAVLLAALLLFSGTALASFRVEDGGWKGPTTQGRTINFRVGDHGGAVKRIVFRVESHCTFGTANHTVKLTGYARIRRHHFSMSVTSGLSKATVKGHFTARRQARGTLQWRTFESEVLSCHSGRIAWRAGTRSR